MDDQERIERGKDAATALAVLLEPAKEYQDDLLSRLIAVYRSSKYTHDQLLSGIAEYAAIDGLIARLESVERQGIVSQQREYNGKEPKDSR